MRKALHGEHLSELESLLEVHGSCLDQVKEPSPKHVSWLQSTYLWGFWEDHRLRKLWAEGRLEFVLWDSMHECQGHLKCMQVSCSCQGAQLEAAARNMHVVHQQKITECRLTPRKCSPEIASLTVCSTHH